MLSGILAVGSGPGAPPEVQVYDAATGTELFQFLAYRANFMGGVSVAVGDVTGTGQQEIVMAPGPGMPGIVKVYSGTDGSLISEFQASPASYMGGLNVAVGDVTGKGHDEIITGRQGGLSQVSIFEGPSGRLLSSFVAYRARFHRGVNIAVGDLNDEGRADIVTAPETGTPQIKIYRGLSHPFVKEFLAFPDSILGGTSVAVANMTGSRTPDIVVAATFDTYNAKVYVPISDIGVNIYAGIAHTPIARFTENGTDFGGTRVAAIDVNGDGTDDIALSGVSGGTVAVLDTSLLSVAASDPFSYSEVGSAPDLTGVSSQVPPAIYTLSTGLPGILSVAATNTSDDSTPADLAARANTAEPSIPPIDRLAYYDPTSGQFVPVTPDDPRLVGKDVTVLIHGWAPGYITWVQNDAALGQVLMWWQTFPGQIGYNPAISGGLPPASEWLLDGHTEGSIVVSTQGMVQDILASDPNAAVLAYSWLDDSATPVSSIGGIPEDAYLSEAKTTLNGERLAAALEEVLGSESAFHGKLQLLGHSHGSKVATVAAMALEEYEPNPITVNQLTILDSPESPDTTLGTAVAELGAANNNWYFLEHINLNRSDQSDTFVDNYISYFDTPYDVISYPGSNPDLQQVVDVSLDAEPYSVFDVSGQHSYAAYWYAGSSEPGLTYGNTVGRLWSPLLPGNTGVGNPPQSLAPSYEQSWTFFDYSQQNQFDLNTYTPSSFSPIFNPVRLPPKVAPGIDAGNTLSGARVQLTQTGGTMQSYSETFTTAQSHPLRGLTFNYQFQNAAPGDELTIDIDGDLSFVMDASLVGSQAEPATISLGDLFGDESHNITIALTSASPNSTSSVIVSDLQQFADE